MCFDTTSRLIIADSLNDRIQCFEYVPEHRAVLLMSLCTHRSVTIRVMDVGVLLHVPEHPVMFRSSETDKRNEKNDEDNYVNFAGHLAAMSHVEGATHGQPSLHRPSDVCVDSFGNILWRTQETSVFGHTELVVLWAALSCRAWASDRQKSGCRKDIERAVHSNTLHLC